MTPIPTSSTGRDKFDPAHDVYHYTDNPLKHIFAPKNVAVIGATEKEGSVGRTILWNLISSPFGGAVFPVNPKRSSLLGLKAYPSIKDIPDPVDLAVIVTPSTTIPGIIEECGQMGVKGAIVISSGLQGNRLGRRGTGAAAARKRPPNTKCGLSARTVWA